jgi:hypothetical protein
LISGFAGQSRYVPQLLRKESGVLKSALKLQVLINVLVIVIVHRYVLGFETVVDSSDVLLSLYAKRIWKRESV